MQRELTFGAYLKQRRKALDLTQEEVADRVGCATETIRKLEAGERRPSKEIAQRLAEVLVTNVDERHRFVQMARGLPPDDSVPPVAARHILPAHLTSFVGRTRESAAVQHLLMRPSVRLLTLVGPPGIGKTRLSFHLAADLEPAFADGVRFVPLAAITDPDLVASAIAQSLGCMNNRGRRCSIRSRTICSQNTCWWCWTTSSSL